MEKPPQSELGATWSIPTPAEMQRPLTAPSEDREADAASAADKAPVAKPRQAITDYYAKFAEEGHSYVREHIRNADQKATFFFAAFTAILAFLNAQNVTTRWLKDVRLWSLVDSLGFVSMLGLAAGACTLLAVVFPRLKGSRRGLLFFNAIAEYDNSTEYVKEVLARSGDDLISAKLQHLYELSRVCTAKYRTLRIGFWAGSIGAAAGLLFLFLAKNGPA